MMGSAFNRARRAPCTSEDLAASVAWGEPVELAAVEARLLGAAPVCFNGARWMAVDEDGRGFVVHVEGGAGQASGIVGITLHVFDVANPSMLHFTQTLRPGRRVSALAAPCIAISSGPFGTRFAVAFLGRGWDVRSFELLYIASGQVSRPRPGRLVSPVVHVYDVLEMQPAYSNLSNPCVFMDNDDHVHVAYTAQPSGGPSQPTVVAYMRAEWNGDPNTWRWNRRELGGTIYDASNASVAARWSDGQWVIVVACKIVQAVDVKDNTHEFSGVYCTVATGGTFLYWGGWSFLSGVDVLAGVPSPGEFNPSAGDPSVWVQGDTAFCVGFHERIPDGLTYYVQSRVATNSAPEYRMGLWALHSISMSDRFGHFVGVSGYGGFGFCVWESRHRNLPAPAQWEVAIATLWNDTTSAWVGMDPVSTGYESTKDQLLFPTSFVVGRSLFVAWLYVDRRQDDHVSGDPLDSVATWPAAPVGAVVGIRVLQGEITCV